MKKTRERKTTEKITELPKEKRIKNIKHSETLER